MRFPKRFSLSGAGRTVELAAWKIAVGIRPEMILRLLNTYGNLTLRERRDPWAILCDFKLGTTRLLIECRRGQNQNQNEGFQRLKPTELLSGDPATFSLVFDFKQTLQTMSQ